MSRSVPAGSITQFIYFYKQAPNHPQTQALTLLSPDTGSNSVHWHQKSLEFSGVTTAYTS